MDNFRDSYFQVDWDLTSKRLKGTYWGKQYDTGRGFAVTVINGGQVVAPTNEVLRLKWEKPDNTAGYVNATIVNGKFIVENIDQMFTVHGSVRADFELSVGGEFVASITFYVNVEKAVAVDAIESSSEFTALQTAVGTVDGLDAEISNLQSIKADKTYVDTAKDNLNGRIDNVISTPTEISEQEIIDSRYDVIDGTLYNSLGERLNQYRSEYVEKNLSEGMLLLKLPNGVKNEAITNPDGNLTAIRTNVKSDIVLNGTEGWGLWGVGETEFLTFSIPKPQNMAKAWEPNEIGAITATDFVNVGSVTYYRRAEGIAPSGSSLTICIKRDKLSTEDVNGFKLWLANNEQRVTYQLETPVLTKIPQNLSANAKSILYSAFEIQKLNLITDNKITFKTLGNDVSNEVVDGKVIRKIEYKVIIDSDVIKKQTAEGHFAVILTGRFDDYKYYEISTSVRERGSAILEGYEDIFDNYQSIGRSAIFAFRVDEERTEESIKDELVGLRLFYELRDEEHISISDDTNESMFDLLNRTKFNDTRINTNSEAIEAIKGSIDDPPEYVKQEIKRIADIIYDEASHDTFVFAALTDLHTTGEDVSAIGVSHAFSAVKEMQQHINLSMVALLGDYIPAYFDNAIAKQSLRYVRQQSLKPQNGKTIFLQGNHDTVSGGSSEEDRDKYYNYIGRNNDAKIDYGNKFRNYGYIDYEENKVRAIYLNTADVTNGESGTVGVSSDQLDWFINEALSFDEKKEGWGVVVMCHHPLNWDGVDNVLKIMGAFKGKKTGEIDIDGEVLTYNFESTEGEFIANFHGHLHNFRAEFLTEPQHNEDVLTITIPNACYGRNNDYGTLYGTETTEKFGDPDSEGNQRVFSKTSGTVEDTSFNFVLVDRVNRKIKCLNYGAGIDREFDY